MNETNPEFVTVAKVGDIPEGEGVPYPVGERLVAVFNMGGGEYKAIDPHSRIVFTWESPFSVEGSTVTLNLTQADEGGTDLELIHVKFPDQESRDNHLGGWGNILATLDAVLQS